MTINHPLQWSKETLEQEWQKIRDGEIVEDYEGDFDLEDILDDETSEDEVNRMTDSMFKEVWGYDYNELINKLKINMCLEKTQKISQKII